MAGMDGDFGAREYDIYKGVDRYKSIVDAQVTATKEEVRALQQQVDDAKKAYDAKVKDKEEALQAEFERLQRLCKRSS